MLKVLDTLNLSVFLGLCFIYSFISLLIALLVLPVCGLFGLFVFIPYNTIYRLTPTEYPGSQLINTEKGGGSGGEWETKTYSTPDNVSQVVKFFEAQIPGFTQTTASPKYPAPAYYNSQRAQGWLVDSEYHNGILIHPDPN